MGFTKWQQVSGQTYTRKLDYMVLSALSGLAQSAYKMCGDIRLLASMKEIGKVLISRYFISKKASCKKILLQSQIWPQHNQGTSDQQRFHFSSYAVISSICSDRSVSKSNFSVCLSFIEVVDSYTLFTHQSSPQLFVILSTLHHLFYSLSSSKLLDIPPTLRRGAFREESNRVQRDGVQAQPNAFRARVQSSEVPHLPPTGEYSSQCPTRPSSHLLLASLPLCSAVLCSSSNLNKTD